MGTQGCVDAYERHQATKLEWQLQLAVAARKRSAPESCGAGRAAMAGTKRQRMAFLTVIPDEVLFAVFRKLLAPAPGTVWSTSALTDHAITARLPGLCTRTSNSPTRDLLACKAVCRSWYRLIDTHVVRQMALGPIPHGSTLWPGSLPRSLQRLALPASVLESSQLTELHSNLHTMHLVHGAGEREHALALLQAFPSLTTLTIEVDSTRVEQAPTSQPPHAGSAPANNSKLRASYPSLPVLQRLKHLELSGFSKHAVAAMHTVGWAHRLTSLTLRHCSALGQPALKYLTGLSALRALEMESCEFESQSALSCIRHLTGLKHLNLSYCDSLHNDGLAHLAHLPALGSLCLADCSNLDAGGISHLAGISSLTRLDLSLCQNIDDKALQHLSRLTNLRVLELGGCPLFTGMGVLPLRMLGRLTYLDLGGCQLLDDVGLQALMGMTDLRHLELGWCRISDVGLSYLAVLTRLTNLSLPGCDNIHAAGLLHLTQLTMLQRLYCAHCNGLDPFSVRLLRRHKFARHLQVSAAEEGYANCVRPPGPDRRV